MTMVGIPTPSPTPIAIWSLLLSPFSDLGLSVSGVVVGSARSEEVPEDAVAEGTKLANREEGDGVEDIEARDSKCVVAETGVDIIPPCDEVPP